MPRNSLGRTPYPLVRIDTDDPLTAERLSKLLDETNGGVSICVRSKDGHPNRGGHFFHMQREAASRGYIKLKTFDNENIDTFEIEKAVRLINHASGIVFDEEMLALCQNKINFRQDSGSSA